MYFSLSSFHTLDVLSPFSLQHSHTLLPRELKCLPTVSKSAMCVCASYIKRKQTEEKFFPRCLWNVKSIATAAKKPRSLINSVRNAKH